MFLCMHHTLRAPPHAAWAIRQTVTALAAIAVIVGMVLIAQQARQDEKHHQTVQVLVERVRASSLELENYIWRELAEGFASGETKIHPGPVVAHALRLWTQLSQAVTALRAADHSAPTVALLNDAGRLYGAGMSLVSSANGLADVRQGMTATEALFAPTVDALDRDAVTAAAAQRRVADQAEERAGIASFGSLAVGLLVLVLLGFQLHRTRRGASLAKQQRTLEQRSERRIRALVEHSSDIIVMVGPDLTIRWQSSAVETGLGHASSVVIGRRVSSLAHPDDAQLLESHLAAAMRQSGPVRVTARFGHAKDGWRDLEVIADNRLTDPDLEAVVLSMRDVSDRKALEDELRHQAFHAGRPPAPAALSPRSGVPVLAPGRSRQGGSSAAGPDRRHRGHAGHRRPRRATGSGRGGVVDLIGGVSRGPRQVCGKSPIMVFEILPIQSRGAEHWMEITRDRTD